MTQSESPLSRRGFVMAGCASAVALANSPAQAQSPPRREPLDIGGAGPSGLRFDAIAATTEASQKPKPAPLPPSERVGFALVGLGRLVGEEIIPAFAECRMSRISGLVSGTPEKSDVMGRALGVDTSARYDYASFDRIADNPDIKVVYVVTPNALHKDLVIRAARAGKHVLCEKPMATSSADARAMIEACDKAGVKLMIAYRSQYQKHHRKLLTLARSGGLGKLKLIEAVNAQNQGDPRQWRLHKAMAGGGSLPDIGLYCLNEARFLTGEEPAEVSARIFSTPGDPRFVDVEEAVAFTLRFPSGVLATCSCSYGAHKSQHLLVNGESGWARMDKAFAYRGQALHVASLQDGVEVEQTLGIEATNQFSDEIDHMAQCVREGRVPRTPGQEGLQDHLIMEAIYDSARTGRIVELAGGQGLDTTRGPMLDDGG